jgi:hypothetical protein
MEPCYLCGRLIKEIGNGEHGVPCPQCNSPYCSDCLTSINRCSHCGAFIDSRKAMSPGSFREGKSILHSDDSSKRRLPRKDYRFTIDYYCTPSAPSTGHGEPQKGVTRNISPQGLCMLTMVNHREGQELNIPGVPRFGNHTSAVVRWVKRIREGLYAVGVSFK